MDQADTLLSFDKSEKSKKESEVYSIRLSPQLKEAITSVNNGLNPSIKYIFRFFNRWKNIEVDIKSELKSRCNEFAQITDLFLKARDENHIEDSKEYLLLMKMQASFIRSLHKLIDDPKYEYLWDQCFNHSKHIEYLKYLWEKH
ncbi:MAG: hypothetical protein HQK51_18935 [Oligoflexia bacterium]|nr:hypothetical protein [Oligoflexia bacterium]